MIRHRLAQTPSRSWRQAPRPPHHRSTQSRYSSGENVMARPQTMIVFGSLLASLISAPAQAQSVADFYRGKTVNVLIGAGAGGEYDLQARLVARHIGKHIPGNPLVVPQNMIGAGGIKMANYLFVQAPRDGTYIGMLGNYFPTTQAVGGQGVQYDAVKFLWLGTTAPVV